MLNNYDSWKTRAPEDDGINYETPCPICTGDNDAPPCGEDCDRLMRRVRNERKIRGLYQACRTALTLAKCYRDTRSLPPGLRVASLPALDSRIVGCLQQIQIYRADIADLRKEMA